jgi:hypothetical protein
MMATNATRLYRHAETQAEARLTAKSVIGAGPPGWCAIMLERADGAVGCVAGQHQVEWWTSPELARQGYRRRVRALNAAGYRRVLAAEAAHASGTARGDAAP